MEKISFVAPSSFFEVFDPERKYSEHIAEYLDTDADGYGEDGQTEIYLSLAFGCLLFRLWSPDAGYYFWPAVKLSFDADEQKAYTAISEYCLRESVREVYVDVPREHIELILRNRTNVDLTDLSDGDGEWFALSIETECTLLDEIPEEEYGRIYLGEFAMSYASEYEKLVTDRHLNRFYGYNIAEDIQGGTGADFIDAARSEFERGESITLAATVLSESGENVFVGEGTLYAFAGDGTASMSFRLLPEYHGMGLGLELCLALYKLARRIGLSALYSEVMADNAPSLAVMRRSGACELSSSDKVRFVRELG